ncbi:MAG: acyltransferase [Ideonella sp.]|nr:acyltransferase [Ideonella sp.]
MAAPWPEPHPPAADKLPLLQVLRALAAGMVVLAHAWDNYINKLDPQTQMPSSFAFGLFGVQVFFAISGFIMVQSAASLPQGWASFKHFFLRRLIRIVPLYWAVTLVYAAKLHLQGQGPSGAELLASLLFWPYAEPGTSLMRPVLGVGWTLNFEMLFYALLSLAMLIAPAWRFYAVGLLLLALSVSRHLGWVSLDSEGASALYLWADDILLYFVLGTCLAHLWARSRQRRSAWLSLPWAVVGLVAGLVGMVAAQTLGLWAEGSPLWAAGPVSMALLWCSVANHGQWQGRWAQGLQRRLVLAGDGSYSTYLIHGFLLGLMARFFTATAWPVGLWGFSLLALVVCTVAGVLSYRWFELPVTQRLKRWL